MLSLFFYGPITIDDMPSHSHVVSVACALPDVFSISASLYCNHASFRPLISKLPPFRATSRFRLLHVLGEGAQAYVYFATEFPVCRSVAVKITVAKTATHDMSSFAYAGHHAQVVCSSFFAMRILYSSVVTTDNNDVLLVEVTDVCEAGDLRRVLSTFVSQKKSFTERDVGSFIAQIGIALNHLHRHRIMHRDIKTANVFANRYGLVKLGDFGLARQFDRSVFFPIGRERCGTAYYQAPEIFLREPYSCKVDMWSLGIVAYELITRKLPFAASHRDALQDQVVRGVFLDVRVHRPDASSDLASLIRNLLVRDPRQRLSIADFLASRFVKISLDNFRSSIHLLDSKAIGVFSDEERTCLLAELDSVIAAGSKFRNLVRSIKSMTQLVFHARSASLKGSLCCYINQALALPGCFI